MPSRNENARCRATSRLVARFLGPGLRGRKLAGMRAHLSVCESCGEHYRASVLTTAEIGRARSTEQKAVERAFRRHRFSALTRALGSSGRSPFWRLRLVLYPALLFLLVTQVVRRTQASMSLECQQIAGSAHVGVEQLSRGAIAPTFPGAWCRTEEGGRALLSASGLQVNLASDTAVLVEATLPVRLRLASGELAISGAVRVTTDLGIVTVEEGDARLVLRAGVLEVSTNAGHVGFRGPDGAREVAPGDALRISPDPLRTGSD